MYQKKSGTRRKSKRGLLLLLLLLLHYSWYWVKNDIFQWSLITCIYFNFAATTEHLSFLPCLCWSVFHLNLLCPFFVVWRPPKSSWWSSSSSLPFRRNTTRVRKFDWEIGFFWGTHTTWEYIGMCVLSLLTVWLHSSRQSLHQNVPYIFPLCLLQYIYSIYA